MPPTLEIDDLSAPQTIAFFDRLMPCGLGEDWTFQDVKQLTFKRGKEDVEGSEDEEISDTDLMGIKQAILEGKNLRVGPEAKMEAVSIPKEENLKLQSLFWNNARNIFYKVKSGAGEMM